MITKFFEQIFNRKTSTLNAICRSFFKFIKNFVFFFISFRYIELLRYGVKSWSDKRRRVDYQQQNGQKDGGWSTSSSTALPSLSTTLPRPRFQSSIGPGGLPDFEPAVSSDHPHREILKYICNYII